MKCHFFKTTNQPRRQCLTLIEVCIAFGILSICLTLLFTNFRTASKLLAKSEKAKIAMMQTEWMMQRLNLIFEHIDPQSIKKEEGKLCFTFENGLDPEMIFSGKRHGELILDETGRFLLKIQGKKEEAVREELLTESVDEVQWDLGIKSIARLKLIGQDKSHEFAFVMPRQQAWHVTQTSEKEKGPSS